MRSADSGIGLASKDSGGPNGVCGAAPTGTGGVMPDEATMLLA